MSANAQLVILNDTRATALAYVETLESLGLTKMKELFELDYEATNTIDETSSEAISKEISRLETLVALAQTGIDAYNELGTLIADCNNLVTQLASANLSTAIEVAQAVLNSKAEITAEEFVAARKALHSAKNLYRIENISTASFNFSSYVTVGDWYITLDKTNNVARVNLYNGIETDVVIPETFTYNGVEYITVGLGNYDYSTWRYNYNNGYYHLKSVILPATLRFLGSYAFYHCQGLTEISIPSSVESIGSYAFANCTSLESMTIPASVTKITGSDPFSNCSNLRTLRCEAAIPPTCSNNFNENIRVVYVSTGSGATYEAATYWKNRIIVDGDGLTLTIDVETPGTLGEKVLAETENLRDVNHLILSGTLNDDDIYNIRNRMTGLLTFDMSKVAMTALPANMFDYRHALQQVVLPDGLTSIGQYAFRDCYNLQDMVLPATLKSIATYAFEDCDNFTNIIIPEGVTSVGTYAFYGCDALQTVKWPSTATTIRDYTFCQSGIKSIEIAEGVTTIGYAAFQDAGLNTLECPSTLTSIEGYAFYNCASLSAVEFNEGLESLKDRAFYNCDALTEIVLPSTLNYCDRPFYNCDNIKAVTCLALFPPTLENNYDIIYGANKEYCTLYGPEWTINNYKLTVGWDKFPTTEPIKDCWPENIAINKSFSLAMSSTLPTDYKPNVSLLYDNNYGYGSLTLTGNSTLSVGTYYMMHSNSYQDYKYGYSALLVNTDMRADNVIVGLSTRNDQWRFISFPFDVKVSDILPAYNNTNFVIRKYSGKDRAEQNFGNTWQDMTIDSVLYAGEGYILQSSRYYSDGEYANWSGFYFYAVNNANKNLIFAKDNRTVVLDEYQSEFSHNRSWNLIGNPYPCFYDTRAMDFTAPITVWDPFNSTYYAYSPVDDEYILSPTEAFFVQRPVDTESITFAADGRQTDRVVRNRATQAKAYTRSANMRQVFNLTLSDGEMSDRTRFVINPDAACDYEMATDANKFMSSDARAAQLYTIEGSVQFAINERPMSNGVITLGAYFGSKGSYTIALDTKAEGISVILVDKMTGTEIDLMEGNYTFTAEAGVADNRFEVRMRADEENGDTTGMESLSGKISVKVAAGQITVTAPCEADIEVYNAKGQRIATATAASATFKVAQGVYVVKVQDAVHKVSVTR